MHALALADPFDVAAPDSDSVTIANNDCDAGTVEALAVLNVRVWEQNVVSPNAGDPFEWAELPVVWVSSAIGDGCEMHEPKRARRGFGSDLSQADLRKFAKGLLFFILCGGPWWRRHWFVFT